MENEWTWLPDPWKRLFTYKPLYSIQHYKTVVFHSYVGLLEDASFSAVSRWQFPIMIFSPMGEDFLQLIDGRWRELYEVKFSEWDAAWLWDLPFDIVNTVGGFKYFIIFLIFQLQYFNNRHKTWIEMTSISHCTRWLDPNAHTHTLLMEVLLQA